MCGDFTRYPPPLLQSVFRGDFGNGRVKIPLDTLSPVFGAISGGIFGAGEINPLDTHFFANLGFC